MDDALQPFGTVAVRAEDWGPPLVAAARRLGVDTIATAYTPVGPARTGLDCAEPVLRAAGLHLCRVMRPYDRIVWPHAKAGFFGLKKKIPTILRDLNLSDDPQPNA